ncbi:MAG TPA: 30S ribosomal protein S9 [Patescibacteria group bacterium]|nr:30S ribosomal protein S9 [Patescibacteria group bacterium]
MSETLDGVVPQSPAVKPGGFYQGTGRRKTAVARVGLRPGTGKVDVNGEPAEAYFHSMLPLQRDVQLLDPFRVTGTVNQFDVKARVAGGGVPAQLAAMRLGIARALLSFNPDLQSVLRKRGMVTRDPRMKERKKYGQKGARRRFQFSKR